jgi:hypothetical protein
MNKKIHVMLLVLLILAVLPFLIIATCNHPLGMHEWDWVTNLKGLTTKMTFWEEQKFYYNNVMGRYSSTWISSLSDNFYTLFRFKVFFVVNILLIVAFIGIAVKAVFGFHNINLVMSTTSILWLSWISGVSGIYDTLYMLTSVHTYLLGFYGLVLIFYLWRKCFNSSNFISLFWQLVLILIITFTIGTNEISLIYSVMTIGLLLVFNFNSKQFRNYLIAFFVISLIFAFISIATPANLIRKSQYASEYSFYKLIFLSFSTSVFNIITWIVNGQLILSSLLFIYLTNNIDTSKIKRIAFPYFVFIVMFSVFCGHFLIIYGTNGLSIAERVVDFIYLHFLFLWFYGLLVFSDFSIFRKLDFKNIQITNGLKIGFSVYFILVLFVSGLSINRENKSFANFFSLIEVQSNIGEAWLTILNGSAFEYDRSMKRQYQKLEKCNSDTCYVNKPERTPKFLYFYLADRRNTNSGDPYIGYYFNPGIKAVKYSNFQY